MIIKQLSVFVENRNGRMLDIARTLAQNDIDISALSLADTSDFGVLRLIVDKPDKAKQALKEIGIVVKISDVIAIAMDDAPGGMAKTLEVISNNGISIEYMYACIGKTSGKALMVMRTEDTEKAEEILDVNGFGLVSPGDIYRI